MTITNLDIVRLGYEAFAAQNPGPVLQYLDSEIEWYVPREMPYGGTFHGPDGVLQMLGGVAAHFAEQKVVPEQFHDAGDTVIVEGRHLGRVRDGREFESGFATVFTLREQKVVRVREYFDATIVNAVVSASASQ